PLSAPLVIRLHPQQPPPLLYPLSLHDALPISEFLERDVLADLPRPGAGLLDLAVVPNTDVVEDVRPPRAVELALEGAVGDLPVRDRKSTRLNSSHVKISYAVFCLKKKTKNMHS